jgi:hypothetical protein
MVFGNAVVATSLKVSWVARSASNLERLVDGTADYHASHVRGLFDRRIANRVTLG